MVHSWVILDTNIWIFGLLNDNKYKSCRQILEVIDQINIFVPRQILLELNENLISAEMHNLYALLNRFPANLKFSWEPVETKLIEKYLGLGCKIGDATIAAHMDVNGIDTLVSENRIFLKNLEITNFHLLNAEDYIAQLFPI